jgi:hypothetical protein
MTTPPASYLAAENARRDASLYAADRERDSRYYTAAGWLTPYALACGYLESFAGWTLRADGGVFHVQRGPYAGEDRVWESFDTLGEARAFFARQIRLHESIARLPAPLGMHDSIPSWANPPMPED